MSKQTKIIIGSAIGVAIIIAGIYVFSKIYIGRGITKQKPDESDVYKLMEEVRGIHPEIVSRFDSYDEKRKAQAIALVTRDWATFNNFKNGIKQKELSNRFKQEFDF